MYIRLSLVLANVAVLPVSDFHSFWPIRLHHRCQTFTRFSQCDRTAAVRLLLVSANVTVLPVSDFHSFWPIRQYRRCQTFTRFGQRTLQPFTRFCQIWIRKPPERMSYFYSFRPGLRMRRHTNNIQRRVSKNFSCHRIYISERSILPRREHKVPYYEISENIEKIRYA